MKVTMITRSSTSAQTACVSGSRSFKVTNFATSY